jgi:type IV pilus assembly protein PilM
MESIGLWPYVIDLDSFALGNAFELHEILAEGKGQGETGKNIALIDIGSSKTLLNIMSNINSYFTREITIAGNDLTDAISKKMGIDIGQAEVRKCNPGDKMEEVKESTSGLLDDLFHEIRLSFDYFEHQFEKTIDSIYISGGSSNLVGLEEAFEKDFQKKLIKWNPIEHFEIDLDKVNQAELSQRISQLTIAVGLASRLRKVY